ncbi:alkaline phosphatase PafA [Mesonia sp. K7]|uniref:alkaline phosphatase PafA n=1 Tax=Mesonia sp. K7 TaxID=2218606 RepID=UPI000DA84984|nr:alkaline phosphatase PafA [Mesonia sp. K7]PZD77169.1 alkaline phosphatase family protein [Mesonia sp. K7]
MKKLFYTVGVAIFLSCASTNKQNTLETPSALSENKVAPKLVVGIVVDQMRYDYLTRFWNHYSENGFKRLVKGGFTCRNNHYNYVPTYTAPGHASIFTGTTPKNHGIISNSWYDKFEEIYIYCVSDAAYESVGTENNAGKMSPKRMVVTTITDQNRLHTQMRGKTIGVAIKDRGAILPAGHTANAAYWFYGGEEGKFISSTFYQNELPQWVKDFNDSGKVASYLTTWETLKPISTYVESGADNNNYEHGFIGKSTPTFPYDLTALSKENGNYDILKTTPFGNNITTDFAKAAIVGEQLGQDDITDFLTLSYSSPDYIGHNFGVNSKEVQDNYLRLDIEVASLLSYLDEKVGVGNYTVFLTADHGANQVPAYLNDYKIPAGYAKEKELSKKLKVFLGETYRVSDLVVNQSNNQLFFDEEKIKENKIDRSNLQRELKQFLISQPEIYKVYTREELEENSSNDKIKRLVQFGFSQKQSGDVVYLDFPAYVSYPEKGSTHGSSFNYDTQVPLIFYGKNINQGETYDRTEIIDIAPTISAMLGIAFPNASTGKVISEVINK